MDICTIGGFSKTEGNSVALKVGEEVIILDMGLSMEDYIRFTEDREDVHATTTYQQLLKAKAVPDYNFIEQWKKKVIAIVPSHGHLDHVGAIPFAGSLFPQAKVISTPYSIEVLKSILNDEQASIPNQLVTVPLNSSYRVSENITVEFVNVTHSIPHTAIVVVHTPEGKVMYANDYKFDRQPVLGQKPNFARLEELGKEGIDLLFINCLYAHSRTKCPSESVARQMLKDTMQGVNTESRAMIVTTFSSHIARLKSIIELGQKLERRIVFLGRSLEKYTKAAEALDLVNFSKQAMMFSHRDKIAKMLRRIQKEGKEKYLIVCTGHQGEPKAILSRIVRKELDFTFEPGDSVIFSCQVIPVQTNIDNREKLEKALQSQKVRIFRDVHVSGHGALEDHRDLLELVRPKHIIPIHAENSKAKMLAELAAQLGFKNTHVMQDGGKLSL